MAGTLYDILEISPKASQEAVEEAFQRLAAKWDPELAANKNNEQAKILHHAIREAYVTLKDPERRKKYDRSLEIQLSSAEIGEGVLGTTKKKIMALILILAVGGFYLKYQRVEELARIENIKAEEAKKAAAEAEIEQARLARLRESQNMSNDMSFRSDAERAKREADYRQREQQRASEQSERQRRSEDAARERTSRMEQQAAEARARQEVARDKQRLRQLEYDRYGR